MCPRRAMSKAVALAANKLGIVKIKVSTASAAATLPTHADTSPEKLYTLKEVIMQVFFTQSFKKN